MTTGFYYGLQNTVVKVLENNFHEQQNYGIMYEKEPEITANPLCTLLTPLRKVLLKNRAYTVKLIK